MTTECVRINSNLLKRVRLSLVKKYGKTKGYIGSTVEKAVENWLESEEKGANNE